MHLPAQGVPVHVGKTLEEAHGRFAEALDILLVFNGAEDTYKKDIMAALYHQKPHILVPLVEHLSSNRSLPARGMKGEIQNAVAELNSLINQVGSENHIAVTDWVDLRRNVTKRYVDICRKMVSPEVGYRVP